MGDASQADLARLQKETKGKDAEAEAQNQGQDILEQVWQLGHYPKRLEKPASEKERAENLSEKDFHAVDDAGQRN